MFAKSRDDAKVIEEIDEWRTVMKKARMLFNNKKDEDEGTEGCIKLLDEKYEDICTIMKKLHARFLLLTDNHPVLEENDDDDDFGNEDMNFMTNKSTEKEEASSQSSSSLSTISSSKSSNSKISLSLTSLEYLSPSGKKVIERRTSPLQRVQSVATSPSISTTSFKDNKEVTILREDRKYKKEPRFENTINSTVLFFHHKHKGSGTATYKDYVLAQKKKEKKKERKKKKKKTGKGCKNVSVAPCQLQELLNKICELKNNISAVEAAQQICSAVTC